jgi:hypothetical protein
MRKADTFGLTGRSDIQKGESMIATEAMVFDAALLSIFD